MNSISRLISVSLLGLACALPSHAVYNANISGVVTEVLTYSDCDQIFFRLQNQPTSSGSCTASYLSK